MANQRPCSGCSTAFLTAYDAVEKTPGGQQSASAKLGGNVPESGKRSGRYNVALLQRPVSPPASLQADDPGEESELPLRPMFRRIGQQAMPREHAQVGRNLTEVQGMMVDRTQPGFIEYRPTQGSCSLTQIDVFVIQEVIGIESTELFDTSTP